MCTPIGHSLAGAIVICGSRFPFQWTRWRQILILLVVANLPDIDFLFGFLKGNPNQYHQGVTHSLLFVILAGVLLGFLYSLRHAGQGLKAGLLVSGILTAHLLCDIFGGDTRPPIGIPLFWPLSHFPVHSPVTIFGSIIKSSDSRHFIGSLFCMHNARIALWETGIMLGVFGILQLVRRRQ